MFDLKTAFGRELLAFPLFAPSRWTADPRVRKRAEFETKGKQLAAFLHLPLLRVQFDDLLLVDRQLNVFPLRQGNQLTGKLVGVGV